jgi:hypothetical protein
MQVNMNPFHDKDHARHQLRTYLSLRKKINFSTVFAGQAVGIKEVEEGIWLVSFMEYALGYIDLEEKTLQPLEILLAQKCNLRVRAGPDQK